MDIKTLDISEVKPYERNPRNNDNAVDYVAESIKQFGFKVPIIIDKDNVIVAGHTRYKAAKKLNLTTIPCIIADDLTEKQIQAYRLADNKVSEFSEWDNELLNKELENLLDFDIEMLGFYDDDIDGEGKQEQEETKPEIEFTEILEEENNYIVLFFDNAIDWLQAESLFYIKTVKGLSTRKDGKGELNKGIGRVLNGADALSKIIDWGVKK